MAIRVVTHNGKMPRDGGKRQGYIADRSDGTKIFIPILGPAVPLASLKRQEPPAPPTTTNRGIVYWNLPIAHVHRSFLSRGFQCSKCGSIDVRHVNVETADIGEVELLECQACASLMRV